MFTRIIYEDWQLVFPVVALFVTATVFGTVLWRAARMKQVQADHLAQLPLAHD